MGFSRQGYRGGLPFPPPGLQSTAPYQASLGGTTIDRSVVEPTSCLLAHYPSALVSGAPHLWLLGWLLWINLFVTLKSSVFRWQSPDDLCVPSRISVWLSATPCAVACQAPLSMGFSRWEQWSGLPCPPPGDLPDPGIEPVSLMAPALASRFFTTSV